MKVKEITLVALLTSLTAMGAFISIPMVPIPITMQSIFVLLSGILLGPILGALSQILYLLIGLMGVPIFSGFSGGINHMFKPSFGFILGFILASFVSGKVFQYLEEKSIKNLFISSSLGSLIMYMIGLPYMYYILNVVMGKHFTLYQILYAGFLIFLPGDLLKIGIVSLVGRRLLHALERI